MRRWQHFAFDVDEALRAGLASIYCIIFGVFAACAVVWLIGYCMEG